MIVIPLHSAPVAGQTVAAGVRPGFERPVNVHVNGLTLLALPGLLADLSKVLFEPLFVVSAAVLPFLMRMVARTGASRRRRPDRSGRPRDVDVDGTEHTARSSTPRRHLALGVVVVVVVAGVSSRGLKRPDWPGWAGDVDVDWTEDTAG